MVPEPWGHARPPHFLDLARVSNLPAWKWEAGTRRATRGPRATTPHHHQCQHHHEQNAFLMDGCHQIPFV
eukprot:5928889-Amphidinium_carterae.1